MGPTVGPDFLGPVIGSLKSIFTYLEAFEDLCFCWNGWILGLLEDVSAVSHPQNREHSQIPDVHLNK